MNDQTTSILIIVGATTPAELISNVQISGRKCCQTAADISCWRIVLHRTIIAFHAGSRVEYLIDIQRIMQKNVCVQNDIATSAPVRSGADEPAMQSDGINAINFNIAAVSCAAVTKSRGGDGAIE